MSEKGKRRLRVIDDKRASSRVEPGKAESGEEKGDEDANAETKDLPIRILPLWAWGVVMIVSFLIALWIVSTYLRPS